MAGASRYRQAWNAGNTGAALPQGLSSMADQDPLIDQAHDAGRTGTPFDEWHAANVKSAPKPTPSRRSGSRGTPGRSGRRPSSRSARSSGRSRTTSPSLADPTGGRLPIGFDGEGIAGIFFGMVLYALVVSVADYGASGPLLWFKAKFMNQAAPAKGSTSASTSPSSGTTGATLV